MIHSPNLKYLPMTLICIRCSTNKALYYLYYSLGDNIAEQTLTASETEEQCDANTENTSSLMDNNVTQGEEDMDISDSDVEGLEHTAESPQQRNERLLQEMKAAFGTLNDIENRNSACNNHYSQDRVIVDVPLILGIFEKGCQNMSCSGQSKVQNTKMAGGVLTVSWKCSEGHVGCWTSSRVLCQHGGNDIFVTSMLIAAGILITGNSFDKIALFAKFLKLGFVSKATYNRVQTQYIVPELKRYWEQMKSEIWDILSREPVVLCGDGRNDSPGHSAKYCMYALMEQFLDIIVDVEVVDKRETGGISTNMEVLGLKRILERLVGHIVVSELVTDASAAVIAMVRKLKGKN